MSGLPKPRSMTSTPARRCSSFSPSMIVKTYGGNPVIRRNSMGARLRQARARLCIHYAGRGVGRARLVRRHDGVCDAEVGKAAQGFGRDVAGGAPRDGTFRDGVFQLRVGGFPQV